MLGTDELFSIISDIEKELTKFNLDGYAISATSRFTHQVRFAVNKISATKTWDETGLEIIIEKNQRVSTFSVGFASIKNIPKMVETALEMMKKTPPREDYSPLPEPADRYPEYPAKLDKDLLERPERLLDLAQEAIETGTSEGAKRVAGTVLANAYNFVLVTSKGFRGKNSGTNIYLDVRAFMDKESTGHASMASSSLSGIDPKKMASIAANDAKLSVNARKLDPGKYNTVFTIDATASLMNLVGASSSAYAVDAGFSFLIGKLGKNIAPENFNIVDDPLNPMGYIVRNFDDEAVPTRKTKIIENGVLKTYLHNRFTAKKFKAEHTGHAGWLTPHPWELSVSPGDMSWEELLESIERGLIVSNATYIRFQNYVKGDFSAIIRDGTFYVEHGEVKYAVKGLRLSDNVPRILSNIIGIGKEIRQVFHWWLEYGIPVITPAIAVKDVEYTKAF
ncbi:MAG: TldD/PmbA family protein [Candidatus Njordarchaeales archaeon]